ncbi:MAG: GAF domain-containing protein, partial [Symploca sp. SIO2B6]|nr:GAF domain-containing protein [Symploca sp. SIO2B6]
LGQLASPSTLGSQSFDIEAILQSLREINFLFGLHYFYFHQAHLKYLFHDAQPAFTFSTLAREYLEPVTGFIIEHVFYFYDSLICLACIPQSVDINGDVASAFLERVQGNQNKMRVLASHAPMNFKHKYDLVQAEYHRLLGNRMEAIELYDSAICGAKAHNYIQEEALANELAAKFYLDWGKEKVAAGYMQESYYCYTHWGAKAKIDDLEQRYSHLLKPILSPLSSEVNLIDTLATISPSNVSSPSLDNISSSTTTSINTALDFASVLKASQAIADSIELDELLQRLTQIILELAGGDRCALFMPNDDEIWELRANTTPSITDLCAEPLDNASHVPAQLVHYVKNTQEVIVIDGSDVETPVIDNYLSHQQPQSVLCLPLLNQGTLVGVLYLQNQLTRGVFSRDRITFLNFLCAQAASSLEKARLYQQSQRNAERLERSLIALGEAREELLQDECIMRKQALALIDLSQNPAIAQGNVDVAFRSLTETTATTLQVERVSIWLFDEDRTHIQCTDLFSVPTQQHSDGARLNVAEYPTYFTAIAQDAILPVQDAWNNPATIEFRNGYLDTLGIVSMLDASFYMDCELRGLVCCEQLHRKRDWSQADQNFVRSVANLVALTLESKRHYKKSEALEQALADLKTSQLQMVQSEKMSALGNLVAGIAHEINNPLGFVSGNIGELRLSFHDLVDCLQAYRDAYPNPRQDVQERLEDTDIDFVLDDLPKMLNSMKSGCDRIRSISTSLRMFSRADTESKVKANIHEGLDSTLLILKYRLKAKDFRPEIQVIKNYGELPDINCFPGQLNQVFMNILANAIDMFDEMAERHSLDGLKANPQQIQIQTQISGTHGVEIVIRDNGKGMSEDVCTKIFDRKFTTKAVGKGTGLGLAIAHQVIVEKHGGYLEVKSELGQGTEFVIHLLPE